MKILTGLLVFILLTCTAHLYAKPKLENIIIISIDTLRADHLGCYGYPLNTSPHIDAFAKDGVRFSRCFTLTPLTAPSFSTLLSSLPPHRHGAKRNGLSIYKHIKTLPYFLKRYGYRSGAVISNWPLRKRLSGLNRHFDSYRQVFTKKRYMGMLNSEGQALVVNRKAFKWLDENHKNRFFLWVQYTEPHAPYIMHKQFRFDYANVKKSVYPPGTRMKKIKRYDSEIAYTDKYVGLLIEKLKELGVYENSLIIFHSDHGESFGEHNYLKHGRKLYNSTMHVPLIVKLPGNLLADTVRHDNVSLMDVSPTIFSILNMLPNPGMQGKALLPDDTPPANRKIFLETYKGTVLLRRKSKKYHLRIKPIRYAVVDGSTKIIYNLKNKSYEAYRFTEDTFETSNINLTEGPMFSDVKNFLTDWVKQTTRFLKVNLKYRLRKTSISQKDYDVLKSLGYIE
jgi:arylsulfatase A-like enzyme